MKHDPHQLVAVLADQAEAAGALDLLATEIQRRQIHQPIGTVRGTVTPSQETAVAIARAIARALSCFAGAAMLMRNGRPTIAWLDVATELHKEGVDARWDYVRPDELRIFENGRPVARVVYDHRRYGLNLEALELNR